MAQLCLQGVHSLTGDTDEQSVCAGDLGPPEGGERPGLPCSEPGRGESFHSQIVS